MGIYEQHVAEMEQAGWYWDDVSECWVDDIGKSYTNVRYRHYNPHVRRKETTISTYPIFKKTQEIGHEQMPFYWLRHRKLREAANICSKYFPLPNRLPKEVFKQQEDDFERICCELIGSLAINEREYMSYYHMAKDIRIRDVMGRLD